MERQIGKFFRENCFMTCIYDYFHSSCNNKWCCHIFFNPLKGVSDHLELGLFPLTFWEKRSTMAHSIHLPRKAWEDAGWPHNDWDEMAVKKAVFIVTLYLAKRCQSTFPFKIGSEEKWPGAVLKGSVFQEICLVKLQKTTSMWG